MKKAFRIRMETEDKTADSLPWQKDLRKIQNLKDNWDNEGACAINRLAIKNVQHLMKTVNINVASSLCLHPTPLGAVGIMFETKQGRIKGEVGDVALSYFVKRPDAQTEYYSFEPANEETFVVLARKLESIA